jgi:rare lipoprotein A (peptidoglycan hydrolase)
MMKRTLTCVVVPLIFLFVMPIVSNGYRGQSPYFFYTYNYKVKKGDNLYRIGIRFEVPWGEIARANNIPDERFLEPGKKLVIKKKFLYNFRALTSWYGKYFHGRKTANGEVYDMYGISAAHKTLPLGTSVLVINPQNGRQLKLRINDRGPYIKGRSLDLSFGAAKLLGIVKQGVAPLLVKVLKF